MTPVTSPSASTRSQPRLIIPIGDPAGIGAEVILKALADPTVTAGGSVTLTAHRKQLHQIYDRLRPVCDLANPAHLAILDIDLDTDCLNPITLGQENAASGAASFKFLDRAITETLAGSFDGIVTGPIAKSAWKAAGHHYPGQTEYLAERAGVNRFGMLFVARSPHTGWLLRALLATTHIPLRQVPDALTPALMTVKLELLLESLQRDFGIATPRIAIAGLNPHSGEQGQLGTEEVEWLIPWLTQMRQQFPHATLEGPVPPDTLWVKPGQAWYGSSSATIAHDGYLALYHDQGLIPVKLMAFDRAVNTSIGLPFIRTSPDHGTAFDIAGKGIADATSMQEAIKLGIFLAQRKSQITFNL
jgi:4-hydroxythreonine-4-phosphate dehydrogenase